MLMTNSQRKAAMLCLVFAVAAIPAGRAAATTTYEDLPTSRTLPPNVSWHNASGPILVDDFIPVVSGAINHVTWWGSQASVNDFEIVLHTDASGAPAITPSGNFFSGGLKQFVTATSFLYNSAVGIWQFDAKVAPGWNVAAGTDYWFTTANVNDGWEWAEALAGPTVGMELYNAHRSVGPGCGDGGPHCGPWEDVHTDLAFRINAVPEPATWALMIGGFGLAGLQMRRRTKKVSFA